MVGRPIGQVANSIAMRPSASRYAGRRNKKLICINRRCKKTLRLLDAGLIA